MTARRVEHVVLVGMMGSGKTSVGRLLAAELGRAFLDNDAALEDANGRSALEIVADAGDDVLHEAERAVFVRALETATPAVLCAPGSIVLDEAGRELVRHSGTVVWLRADPSTLAARVKGSARPLLGDDPASRLPVLDAERRPGYEAVARHVVDVDDATPEAIAALVAELLRRRLRVELGDRAYEVVVGPGARLLLPRCLPAGARRAVVVTEESIGVEVTPGIEATTVAIDSGEQAKSLATIEGLCRRFSSAGLTRHDVVVALGGGVVTDVAGYAAASYLRGVALVNVSTTLLGQVDAAIGGKTGVNLPEGKNLVGAFHQPEAVLCDTDTLVTLPEREWRSGFGELAKYAFIGVDDLDRLPLVDQVARCVALKAEIVAADERESGLRMLLNYGHTLAHALEASGFADGPGRGGVDLRHGEAVAIGVVFAARLAAAMGRIDQTRVDRHLEVVAGYGLETEIPQVVDAKELLVFMARDKKVSDGLTFVLDGPDGVEPVHGVSPELVLSILEANLGAR